MFIAFNTFFLALLLLYKSILSYFLLLLSVSFFDPAMKTTKQSISFHSRPVTNVRFHPDGDLLFACSKDASACVCNMDGKLLGSFEDHNGSVTSVSAQENVLVTGCTDMTIFSWDILTGRRINTTETDAIVRGIDYQSDILFCTDKSMNRECYIGLYDFRDPKIEKLYLPSCSATSLFRYRDYVVLSDDSGRVYLIDIRERSQVLDKKVHDSKITSIRPSSCRSFFVSGSKDTNAKIIDTLTFEVKKKFECGEPVNAAAIFPTNDKLIAVGGIDARDVTTTRGKGTFDANFFDVVTQKKIGTYSTHFGTINALDIHPASTHYATGGEDGSLCLVRLGDDLDEASFTPFEIV